MSAHTPGPWGIDTGGDVIRSDGTTLLTREEPSGCSLEETFANANLAASAPELLEALRDVLGWIPDGGPWHTDAPLASVARARAAITKATGAQP